MLNELWPFLASWYNLPYTSLVAVSLLLALVQLMGLGGEPAEDSDLDSADADADVAAEAEAAADVDSEVDSDADSDVDQDVDHELDHETAVPSALGLLAFLGLGKAPLFVVLPILFGAIGLLGWLFNAFAQSLLGGLAAWSFLLGLLLALCAGSLASARLARLIGAALPPLTNTATRAAALVGRQGTVISPFVDDHYGLVHLRNAGGTLMSVFAVTDDGARIRRGKPVVLVAYEPDQRRYIVASADTI
jgi:membrane protein implicated in regulation of membrane protease activity